MDSNSPENESTGPEERRVHLTESLLEVFAKQQSSLSETFIKQQQAFGETVMAEVKATRRNANIRTAIIVLGVAALFLFNLFIQHRNDAAIPEDEDYISLVRLVGSIEPGSSFSLKSMERVLHQAFHDKESKGVLLVVNSPGGTPVQSDNLYRYLLKLKNDTGKKLVVLGEDYLTSGAYMMSMSADKIFVNQSTMTGSIGVYQQSFGFKELADRLGIEPRSLHSGEHKRRLDPFSEASEDDIHKIQTVLNKIHTQFINTVKKGREGQLKGDQDTLFSGDYWDGEKAVQLGLADRVASYYQVLNDEFSVEHAKDYTPRPSVFDRLSNNLVTTLAESLQARLSL